MGVMPVLMFIADEETDFVEDAHGLVKKVKSVEGLDEGFQAQIIRMYAATYFQQSVILTSDIDMLPLSKAYFEQSVASASDDALVILSADAYRRHPQPRFPICYNAARGSVFCDLLQFENTFEDYAHRLAKFSWGWDTDELYFGKCVFESRHKNIVKLNRGWGRGGANKRIDRSTWTYNPELLAQNHYIDSHLLRPYSEHRAEIDRLA